MRYLIANWKMNLPKEGIDRFTESLAPSTDWSNARVGVAPPFPFIGDVRGRLNERILVGAQNCSDHPSGAYTGEVAPSMAGAAGASFVIVGHSERRTLFAETDERVGSKVAAVFSAGLDPLLCVGEDSTTRENGGTVALLARQLEAVFAVLTDPPEEMMIAYEPVWAIGTGRNATPAMAAEAHEAIRRIVGEATRRKTSPIILYGGSVKPDNAAALAAEEQIEGFLVGGASLEAAGFLRIGEALEAAAPAD